MTVRARWFALAASLAGSLFVTGCNNTVQTGPSGGVVVYGVYQQCNGPCAGGSDCVAANTTTDGFVGTFCTNSCDPFNPVCLDDGTNITPVCVPDANNPNTGQCYAGCPQRIGCPAGETCATQGGINFCVP